MVARSKKKRQPSGLNVVIPGRSAKRFYGHGIPGVDLRQLNGKLIVVEGADGSGRSTQTNKLVEWLEGGGHATVQVGLKRSTLVSEELQQAQEGNILSRTTLSLFYATDFADQLENLIIPALKAGSIVIADRYIYTLMARDLVRGMDMDWLRNVYDIALRPDAVFYLQTSPETLVQRNFAKKQALDYWESGMDLGLSRDMFDSFLKYQSLLVEQFLRLKEIYKFNIVDANQPVEKIQKLLRRRITSVLRK
ncbi:MAG: dTMP kinase [Verrucomicrobiales bacterium]|nr:dTMP kinase [Verrucomicrobiales bacterium]|tara:strand:- start:15 stop:764 length:750 start_codon:yes stop_codon:yes gene_type:complete